MNKIWEVIKRWSEEGVRLPMAYDGTTKQPSVTLLFVYTAFMLCFGVVIYLAVKDAVAGTTAALMLFFGSLVIYRLRKLDKVKFSLTDKEITLDSSDEPKQQ